MKELNLTIGQKYTVLNVGDLVPTRIYGTLKGYYYGNFAQYKNALYIYIQRPRAKKVDRLVFTVDTIFIFKGNFKECWRKEVIKESGTSTTSLLHRFTYNDLKDNKDLVYYNDGLKQEYKPITDNFEWFIDSTGDYLCNNNIRAYEALENEGYINYMKSLLTKYNVNKLKEYIINEGYNMLENCINKAVEYNW